MTDETPMPVNPPEMIQVFICPGCERLDFIDQLEQATKEQYNDNRRMVCGNCETVVGAEHIHDYALYGGIYTDE